MTFTQELELNIRMGVIVGALIIGAIAIAINGYYKGWRTYDYLPQLWASGISVILSWELIFTIYAFPVYPLIALAGAAVTILMFFVIALGREGIRQSADILEKGFKFALLFSLAVGVWILVFGTLGMPSYIHDPEFPYTACDGLFTSFGYADVTVLAMVTVKILRKK